jgi:ATP-dependent DNA helicase RecG
MPEQQNIEYKSSWHDNYLKWVCGFANTQGSTIYIGMNDVVTIVGVEYQKTPMEEIPNKINNNNGNYRRSHCEVAIINPVAA